MDPKLKWGLDEVHVLHEGTWVAQNDPIPSSDRLRESPLVYPRPH
jgi:hypothetical protein